LLWSIWNSAKITRPKQKDWALHNRTQSFFYL